MSSRTQSPLARFRCLLASHANNLPLESAKQWLTDHRLLVLHNEPTLYKELQIHLEKRRTQVLAGNVAVIKMFQQIVDALKPIPIAPLKGIALLDSLYIDDLGARPLSDIDILVPEVKIDEASNLLLKIGFEENQFFWRFRKINYERTFCHGWAVVDLQSRLGFLYGRNFTWDTLPLKQKIIHERNVYHLLPTATLIQLIIHCYKHRLFSSLLWIHEILAISEKLPLHPLSEITTLASRLHCRNVLAVATLFLRQAIGDDILPQIDVNSLEPNKAKMQLLNALFVPEKIDVFVPFAVAPRWKNWAHAPLLTDSAFDMGAELLRIARVSFRTRWPG